MSQLLPVRRLLPLGTFLVPLQAATAGESGQLAAGYLGQLIGGLVVVILAIVALAWVMRRMPALQGQGPSLIQVLAVRNIGARERLMLVQVGEEQVLIGVGPAGMQSLHALKTPVEAPPQGPAPGEFARVLGRVRKGGAKA